MTAAQWAAVDLGAIPAPYVLRVSPARQGPTLEPLVFVSISSGSYRVGTCADTFEYAVAEVLNVHRSAVLAALTAADDVRKAEAR